ncbi:hypothetical protein HOY82DRAFT_541295 [Tuber indicum]|nr:hypothetical protein HOY82DRAFT_541295 [Tuber indicum]
MTQKKRVVRASKRVLRTNKRVNDSVSILFEAMGVDCRPYPVVTPGYKDPFPGLFGTCRKPFSDAPKGCTKAEIDSDLAAMWAQIPKPPVKHTPRVCTKPGIGSDTAETRDQLPKPPVSIGQHPETAGVLEFVKAAFPTGTKPLRIILRIPVPGNRITKKPPTSKKQKKQKKPLDIPKTPVSTEVFKMPAALNGPKPVKAPRAPSPEKEKVKESQPPLRRSTRPRKSPKFSD